MKNPKKEVPFTIKHLRGFVEYMERRGCDDGCVYVGKTDKEKHMNLFIVSKKLNKIFAVQLEVQPW